MSACATPAASPPTPTHAEVLFRGADAPAVQSKLATACLDRKHLLVRSEATQVVCQIRLNDAQSMGAQLALGNAYSTPPVNIVRFVIVPTDPGVRVQAHQWLETQMPGGQGRAAPLTGGKATRDLQAALIAMGGEPVS